MKKQDFFWITNIVKKAVHLGDIGVVIQPRTSINLLDKKHYTLTKEQLEKSAKLGSLFAKNKMVVIRKVPPNEDPKKYLPFKEDAVFTTKQRSTVEIENVKYEELQMSDDDFAEENADMAEADHLGKWKK